MRMPQSEINRRAANMERIEQTMRCGGAILLAALAILGLLTIASAALAAAISREAGTAIQQHGYQQ